MKVYKIAGVDEAGRGPLAGPVVAASVIIEKEIQCINDSKKISESKRYIIAEEIYSKASAIGVGMCEPKEIDELNIHNATLLAMKRAIYDLCEKPNHVLIDGKFIPEDIPYPCFSIVKGDSSNYSISAASIIAKTIRDNIMIEYEKEYPEYQFAKHKGYPTSVHIDALNKYGPSPIHRYSYAPVKHTLKNNYGS